MALAGWCGKSGHLDRAPMSRLMSGRLRATGGGGVRVRDHGSDVAGGSGCHWNAGKYTAPTHGAGTRPVNASTSLSSFTSCPSRWRSLRCLEWPSPNSASASHTSNSRSTSTFEPASQRMMMTMSQLQGWRYYPLVAGNANQPASVPTPGSALLPRLPPRNGADTARPTGIDG